MVVRGLQPRRRSWLALALLAMGALLELAQGAMDMQRTADVSVLTMPLGSV
jgi:hypothetical protein